MADQPTHLEMVFSWILENVTPKDLTPDDKLIIEYDGYKGISIGAPNSQPGEDQKETLFCIRTPKTVAKYCQGGYYGAYQVCKDKQGERIPKGDEKKGDADSFLLSQSGGGDAIPQGALGQPQILKAPGSTHNVN